MTDENAGQDRPAVEGNELERSWWGVPPAPGQEAEPDAQPPVNDAPTYAAPPSYDAPAYSTPAYASPTYDPPPSYSAPPTY